MSLALQAEVSLSLVLAALLSVIAGIDRERRDRPAGLRTHMLIGVGACLFTLLSKHAFPAGDPARVASNVVTGIGFLGAGVIWRLKRDVKDLTTAANIWTTAAVGMAVGVGAWLLATTATLTVWIILVVIRRFSKQEDEGDYDETHDAHDEGNKALTKKARP